MSGHSMDYFQRTASREVGDEFWEVVGSRRYKLKVLVDEEGVRMSNMRVAVEICERYSQMGRREPVLLGVLKGAFVFLSALVREMNYWNMGKADAHRIAPEFDFIPVSSYKERAGVVGMASSGKVEIKFDEDQRVLLTDRDVLVVEDVGDTCQTLDRTLKTLALANPRSLMVACMVVKDGVLNKVQIPIDFVGVHLPDVYLVGCGLDSKQHLRHLPYIAHLLEDNAV